jgi:hypothetical protein
MTRDCAVAAKLVQPALAFPRPTIPV